VGEEAIRVDSAQSSLAWKGREGLRRHSWGRRERKKGSLLHSRGRAKWGGVICDLRVRRVAFSHYQGERKRQPVKRVQTLQEGGG